MGRTGYGALLRTPGAWAFLVPAFAARLPYAMLTMGVVLLVHRTHGSYGTAGGVAAAAAVAQALAGPQTGRLADRYGQAAVLVPGVLLHAASTAALTALALGRAPVWALFAAAAPAGATVPQIGAMVRARWVARLDGGPLLGTAFAFESVTDEFTFVVGPVLATALCTGVAPAAGLAAEAALTVAGGLAFAALRRSAPARHPRPAGGGRRASALAVPGVRLLVLAFLGVGSVFGAVQVSVTASAGEAGRPGMSGTVYGVFAVGSMLAGVLYGAVPWRRPPHRRMPAAYLAMVLGCSALWALPDLTALAAGVLVCGLTVAPNLITGYTLVESLVPAGAKTEAFTWLTGAIGLGLAAGSTAAGQLVDAVGARAGFLVPVAGTGAALAVLLVLRGLLEPGPAPGRTVARGTGAGGRPAGRAGAGAAGTGTTQLTPAALD
ncbi:MFS transporter [Streptacidiphilus sp. ASG 303]|uniref:MFS transporter n=1 Tax=Streptacidiphilus sp. ASG 303 TaxID=2896847 RepID=UPI001E6360C9|nr:MFS transporter [Streptacidiphilus sp. ASG 303]MCD0483979.1 MFS transporter [Streptacidiphilus sp. ASG 303]